MKGEAEMMTSIVQTTTNRLTELARRVVEIPPAVLMIGKKRASDYIAPALFRIGSFSRVEIQAKGSLSISTAVDVAELVKRNVQDAAVESISLSTEELIVSGTPRRVSCIAIDIAKKAAATVEEQEEKEEYLPQDITTMEAMPTNMTAIAPIDAANTSIAVVEQDPAVLAENIIAERANQEKEKSKPKPKKAATTARRKSLPSSTEGRTAKKRKTAATKSRRTTVKAKP